MSDTGTSNSEPSVNKRKSPPIPTTSTGCGLMGTIYFILVLCVLFFLLPREKTLYVAATGVGAWFWAYYIWHHKSPNLWATLKVILVI